MFSRSAPIWLVVALAACGTEETLPNDAGSDTAADTAEDSAGDTAQDTDGDTAQDTGDDTAADTAEDTSVDTGDDTAADTAEDTAADTAEDTDGDTVQDTTGDTTDCHTACGAPCPPPELQICGADGARYCNSCELGCAGVEPATDPSICGPLPACNDGDVRSTECESCVCVEGAWSCRDTCDPTECLLACGIGCPAPEFQPCGLDGQLYCTTCVMGCYGVTPADDPAVCAACRGYDASLAVPWTQWPTPPGCDGWASGTPIGFAVATNESELDALLDCTAASEPSGIDWSRQRAVRVVREYNPSLAVTGAFAVGGGTAITTTSEVYCGGAPPPTSFVWVLIAAGTGEVTQQSCTTGHCFGPPRP